MNLSFIEKASVGLGFSMNRIALFDSSILHGYKLILHRLSLSKIKLDRITGEKSKVASTRII
jgi:hypothetical protein